MRSYGATWRQGAMKANEIIQRQREGRLKIIGAGLAGLLAANMMRKNKKLSVMEIKSTLPNNHSAVLRFRSHIIGDVTGIDFQKVSVIKASMKWMNPVADALAYAEKSTGMMLSNRSIPTEVEMVERYIAPPDLINQLAAEADISYEAKTDNWLGGDGPTISTIPMPALMDILHYPESVIFNAVNGSNVKAKVFNCNAYVSLYVPSPVFSFSRVSITGDELIAEFPHTKPGLAIVDHRDELYAAASMLGLQKDRLSNIQIKEQTYAKIQEIDDGIRKRFITWATDHHNIYSLGRFACWRPGLLLDDLVKDVRLIEGWIKGGQYTRRIDRKRMVT